MAGFLLGAAGMFAVTYSTQAILPELGRSFGVSPAQAGLTISVVVLGAVLNLAVPSAAHNVPPAAAVIGSEPALVEALTRIKEWLVADSLTVSAEPFGSWWKVRISVSGERRQPAVPELGEPLVRLIVDTHLDGWLDVSPPDGVDIYLPAYHPR